MKITQKDIDRFWSKVGVKSPNECWLWGGAIFRPSGYGAFHIDGKTFQSHRFSYLISIDDELPEHVCHECDVRHCVNFHHLFAGDAQSNQIDCVAKGRDNPTLGRTNGMNKLHENEILEIRKLYRETNLSQAQIADKFNISRRHVSDIVNNKRWSWLSATS